MELVLSGSKTTDEAIGRLFEFYIDSHLDPYASFKIYRRLAVDALSRLGEIEKSTVENLEFNDEGLLENLPQQVRSSGDFDTQLGFVNLIAAMKGEITKSRPVLSNYKGMIRQEVPPLEVYKFVGHNELDIKHSKRGYSHLFD